MTQLAESADSTSRRVCSYWRYLGFRIPKSDEGAGPVFALRVSTFLGAGIDQSFERRRFYGFGFAGFGYKGSVRYHDV